MSRVHEALVRAVPKAELPEADTNFGVPEGEEENSKRGVRSRAAAARQFAGQDERPANADRRAWSSSPASLRAEVVKLVQRLFVFPNSHAPRSVVFSSVEGSGSTQVCFRVAEVLAEGSASVCVISTWAPVPESVEGANECRGWAGAITSSGPITEFVLPTVVENLWLIPAGTQETAHLFPSNELRSRIVELKKEFDYVLIDAPALTASPNAVVLGQMADGVILVVEANCTRHETARIAKETLDGAKVKVLGAILNNHTLPGA